MTATPATPMIWLFNEAKSNFAGGVFTRRDLAEKWIWKHRLTGTLTLYPVDVGAYEWAIEKGIFRPRKPHPTEARFIGGFTDAGMEHDHYENGVGGYIASGSYWNAIATIWDAIDIDTPESFEATFGVVQADLGLLCAAHFCQSEIHHSGGFGNLFLNHLGVLVPEAIRGFDAIGQKNVAEIVGKASALIGSPYLRKQLARQAALKPLLDAQAFTALQEEFWGVASENGGFESAANDYAAKITSADERDQG